jgi:hypothetical protein
MQLSELMELAMLEILVRANVREGSTLCFICGKNFQRGEMLAIVEDPDGEGDDGSVCLECVRSGPDGIKRRALETARRNMAHAKASLAFAEALQAVEIVIPTGAGAPNGSDETGLQFGGDQVLFPKGVS